MERIINKQLLDYLLKHRLITKEQHGFIQCKSICGNLLESLCDWTVNLESRLITDVVYMDFKKHLILFRIQNYYSSFKHTGYVVTYWDRLHLFCPVELSLLRFLMHSPQ